MASTSPTMDDLALHINTTLRLPLIMDSPTPGRGNCFFAAMCQQLNNRQELNTANVYTAASLRKQVCEFALARTHPLVQKLAEEHDNTAAITLRAPWASFFAHMKKSGVFAEGPVLYCTALLLQLDIALMSFGNTIQNPYLLIPGHGNSPAPPPIYVGNLINLHFQSFLPEAGASEEDLKKLTEHPAGVLQKTTVTTSTVPTTPSLPKEGKPLKRKSLFNSGHSSFIAAKKKNLRGVQEIGKMGDDLIQSVIVLVKENRRLHALVQSLEFKLGQCQCEVVKEEVEEIVVVEVKEEVVDEFDAFNVLDSVDDDVLSSTPL